MNELRLLNRPGMRYNDCIYWYLTFKLPIDHQQLQFDVLFDCIHVYWRAIAHGFSEIDNPQVTPLESFLTFLFYSSILKRTWHNLLHDSIVCLYAEWSLCSANFIQSSLWYVQWWFNLFPSCLILETKS